MIYLIFFIASSLLVLCYEKRKKKIFLLLAVILLAFLAAFRAKSVGTDTATYIRIFEKTKLQNLQFLIQFSEETGLELGFLLLNRIFSVISCGEIVVFFVCALLTNSFMLFGMMNIHKTDAKCSLSVMYFLYCCFFYNITLNGMRQFVAVAICFYLFSDLEKISVNRVLFWGVFSLMFHYSGVIILFIYLLYILAEKKYFCGVSILIDVVLFLCVVLIPFIASAVIFSQNSLARYTAFEDKISIEILGDKWTLVIRTIFFVLFCFQNRNDKRTYRTFIEMIAIIDVAFAVGYSIFMYRLSCFFSIYECIYAVKGFRLFYSRKRWSNVILCIIAIGYWIIKVVIANLNETFPYSFIF